MVATSPSNSPASRNPATVELKGDREVVVTRTFNGPARIVFDVWTRADMVKRWWAPASLGTRIASCEADVKVGGRYRYALHNADGSEVVFYGVYSEVTPHSRLVYTSIFEMFPDAPVTVTVTFEERNGKTLMVSHELYATAESRSGALASGMELGMRESLDQLDDVVMSLR